MKVAEDLHDDPDVSVVQGVVLVVHAKVLARPMLDVLKNLKKRHGSTSTSFLVILLSLVPYKQRKCHLMA